MKLKNAEVKVWTLYWFVCLLLLTGDLEAFKKQAFVLKEGVEYRIKISFKVRAAGPFMKWVHLSLFSADHVKVQLFHW